MSALKDNLASTLSQALTRLAFDQPFFGTLLAMTDLVEDPRIPTLATNGERIYYNPRFLKGLKPEELVSVLLHELFHIAYLHCDETRQARRERCGWNAACDFAINQELVGWGFAMPAGVLLDHKYKGQSAEEIYERLSKGGDCRCFDQLMPMPAGRRDEVLGRVMTAAAANPKGVPRALGRWLDKLRAARVPWRRILHRFLHEALAREEQSFLPPSRRHLWDDRYMPSTAYGKRGNLVVAVDTSASIKEERLAAFAAEIQSLSVFCDELQILTCDAKIHESVKVREFGLRLKSLRFKGGGGTDFRPVFDCLRRKKMRPDALVYLTDAEGTFPKAAPKAYPVLWCVSGDAEVPWGARVSLAE